MGQNASIRKGIRFMKQELAGLTALVPDLFEVLHRRYDVLFAIASHAPIGRRLLAEKLSMSERSLRTEVDFLKEHQLIRVSREGMTITDRGRDVIAQLQPFAQYFSAMDHREQQLAQCLNIERVFIVPGDLDSDTHGFEYFGRMLTEVLETTLTSDKNVIAVLGGSTLRAVVDHMGMIHNNHGRNIFVSGRGGMGDELDVQANTISDCIARQSGGEHVPLYAPDYLSRETYDLLKEESSIQKVLRLLSQTQYVIHGIGDAMSMASARGMTEDEIKVLKSKKAVAETFGYFYNSKGEVVYQIPRIGLQLNDLDHISHIFAVAGGKHKAKAIHAYMQHAPKQTWLITDEGASEAILAEHSL